MSEPGTFGNVLFLSIARVEDRMILASLGYGAQIDLGGVQKVISPSSMTSIQSGQHYSFTSGSNAWHLFCDEALVFIVITNQMYPSRHAFALLEELQRTFAAKAGPKAAAARENSLSSECKSLLTKLCQKYDDLKEIDPINKTMGKVEAVKLVMQENVEIALQNCVTMEQIEAKAEDLQQGAAMFKTRAKDLRSKMWWKKLKMQLLLALIVIIVLLCIIVPTAIYFDQMNGDDKKSGGGGGGGGGSNDDATPAATPSPVPAPTTPAPAV